MTRHLSLLAALCLAAPLAAQPVVPLSYTLTPGEGQLQGGSFNYFDETGQQLIDGVLGVDSWAANLGNGAAYEWVGWRLANPVATFTFAQAQTITQVRVGINNQQTGGVFGPTFASFAGTDFNLTGNEVTPGTRGWLTLDGSWTGDQFTLSLADIGDARWIFVDEVEFIGTPNGEVPEPATFGLLATGVIGLAVVRRRARRDVRRT